MKSSLAGLQNQVQTSYSNNGQTTVLGRASQSTIGGQQVIGPPLTQFIDVETQAGIIPQYSYYNPATGHLFVLGSAITAGVGTILLYNFTNTTGAYSYVGKITFNCLDSAATTFTFDGFTVYENGANITPLVTVKGSIAINGGTYMIWNCAASQFTVGGTNIPTASGSNQNAVYLLQDGTAGLLGVGSTVTTPWGNALPQFSPSSGVNTKVWQWNGTVALPQLFSWDLSITPTVAGLITNGVSAQTTTYAGTGPGAYFTMGSSSNGYSATNGDPVVITGTVPANFTAWSQTNVQTAANGVYFVRDLQQVGGAWYFNLSATTGAAAVVPTSSVSNFTMLRAGGACTANFSLKTGVFSTGFGLGALLTADSVGYCKPVSAPANTALNGQDCLYMATTTGLYMGKISDLSSGGTTWASMTFSGVNATGTGIDIVAPTIAYAAYSGQNNAYDVDRWIYTTASSAYVTKPYQNSNISVSFGGTANTYYETLGPSTVGIGVNTLNGIDVMGGWLFVCSAAVGQRGIVFADLYSDQYFGNTSVISPVLSVPPGSVFNEIDTRKQLTYVTARPTYFIRSASTSTDPIFSSATGGWVSIAPSTSLAGTTIGPYFQLMAMYNVVSYQETPAQINDFVYTYSAPGEQSDYWSVDNDYTTQLTGSPSYVAWYMTQVYSSSVPTLYARVIDTNGNLIFNANTSANPTSFQYSTNGGTSWTALGTIPNTVGTLVRVLVTPTPLVLASPSLRES